MNITREEALTLIDVHRGVNRLLHDRAIYDSLKAKGLIYRSLVCQLHPTELESSWVASWARAKESLFRQWMKLTGCKPKPTHLRS